MSRSRRMVLLGLTGLLAATNAGCNSVPPYALRQSQLRAAQLYQENQATLAQLGDAQQRAALEAAKAQQLAQQNSGLESLLAQTSEQLGIANQRVANYQSTQAELEARMVQLINQQKNLPSPLSNETSKRFEELAKKYPNFEFDPATGVSKFHSDILFSSGSAQLKRSAEPLLKEFASIMNEADARRLNILIVGHTDDKPIGKPATRQEHPTNGHLSTNRGHSVRMALGLAGITDGRIGVAGYGPHQPVVAKRDENTRQLNRRVEIFVLAPDAVVAGWDPLDSNRN
jgi:chemotaxis protein MotB